MQNVSVITKPKINLLSILLSTVGFGGIVYGFSGIGQRESTSIAIVTIIVGILSLFLFSIRQFSIKSPIVNLKAFKQPMFALGTLSLLQNMEKGIRNEIIRRIKGFECITQRQIPRVTGIHQNIIFKV